MCRNKETDTLIHHFTTQKETPTIFNLREKEMEKECRGTQPDSNANSIRMMNNPALNTLKYGKS